MFKWIIIGLLPLQVPAQPSASQISRWENQASRVTIIRDNYGVPHIYGKTDADAVFGMIYAQCEDDFKRIEMNYAEKLGRLSSINGEKDLYNDLLIRMIIDPEEAKADYRKAPGWLRKLCDAWADGINYYLYKHPAVRSVLGGRYEPWYPLLWTDGSIGAINTAGITAGDVKNLYGGGRDISSVTKPPAEEILTGSNGFAFSPKITASGNAILYINPHVTFYFRPEVHMASEEGLNVYGAVTWGQFFIYQGFNEHCGWMHTSSAVDAADSYIEKISRQKGKWICQYNGSTSPVREKKIGIACRNASGGMETKTFNVLFTRHGPVMAKKDGQYLSVRADNRLLNGLIQCWQRTKASGFAAFKKTLDLEGNISNNTVYADAEGNIAYWHGNRIPKRDTSFDWTKPVDGSITATEWKGYHPVSETVQCINPPNGWLQNCNSTPFTVAGNNSPQKENFPAYMAPDGENFRGINAVRVLSEGSGYTIDKVIKAGYDTRLAAFEVLVPALLKFFDTKISLSDSLYHYLLAPIDTLRRWDYRTSEQSVATTLAVQWGTRLQTVLSRYHQPIPGADQVEQLKNFAALGNPDLMQAFTAALQDLQDIYGRWNIPWGEINRFQRISGDIENKFDDNKPSYPVGFASSAWGMLPSYTSSYFPGTKKRYGVNGNSFVCAVEFGKKITAKSLLAGGESGDPASPHFFDQGQLYSKGQFKDVLFYKEDVLKHMEKTYHPGE